MDKLSNRLSALAEKATKGPWNHLGYCGQDGVVHGPKQTVVGSFIGGKTSNQTGHQCFDNATLIVELVNALPTIISALQKEDL